MQGWHGGFKIPYHAYHLRFYVEKWSWEVGEDFNGGPIEIYKIVHFDCLLWSWCWRFSNALSSSCHS